MNNEKKVCVLVTVLLILTTVLTSCMSYPKNSDIVDTLDWTLPPDPIQDDKPVVKFDGETDTVSMPVRFWVEIVKYISDTETNISIIKNRQK